MRAQLVNLSHGGLCARGVLPPRLRDGIEQRPGVLKIAVGLQDGTAPITAEAKLAWVNEAAHEAEPSFGLCFVDLSGEDQARLDAAILARLEEPPTVAPHNALRLRLASGPVLRAEADSVDATGALIGAELPWLRVGAELDAEIDGDWIPARASWIGLDVAPSGIARLRMRIAFVPRGRATERREVTLPYFSTEAARAELSEHDSLDVSDEVHHSHERSRVAAGRTDLPPLASQAQLVLASERRRDESRGHELVRIGAQRRRRLALLRVGIVLLSLSALYLAARHFSGATLAPGLDVPTAVRPATASASAELPSPQSAAPIESERAPAIDEPLETSRAAAHPPRAKKQPRKR